MKKILSLIASILLGTVCAFALPGVKQQIPDLSGQFVYYKDNSFKNESYFGILFYDEATYCLRFYSPDSQKDIQTLVSLNTNVDYVDLTGERIITAVTPEDTDLVNYLHDLLYELTARRQKAGDISEKTSVLQDYEQFGGKVTVNFSKFIPIFGIKNIVQPDGTVVFSAVSAGQMASSEDRSFFNFTGLPLKVYDVLHNFKNEKGAKKQKISYSKSKDHTQKLRLDSQWTQSAENLFFLGASENSPNAILMMDVLEIPESEFDKVYASLSRKFTLGTENSYPDLGQQEISESKNSIKITNLYFNLLSNTFTKDFKILTKLDEDSLAVFTLTVFYGAYRGNNSYFDSIVKSYSAK